MLEEEFVHSLPKLGFGLMRLPRLSDGSIDVQQASRMTDAFLEAGLKYFDTAYVYQGSEDACRKALVERHPRDSYYLADKLNAGSWAAKSADEAKKELEISLQRTGAGYFDFYLLHAIGKGNIQNYDNYGIWDFVKEAKEKGLIRHYGFSFHDTPEFLDDLLSRHPDVEFVQLQLNYADWDNPSVRSRECYEVCVKHNKPVVVMEPIKGGTLINLPQRVKNVFDEADPAKPVSSWALRFAASLPDVMVVLSGMSSMEQMEQNLSFMKNFRPFSKEEAETVEKARKELMSVDSIPCTGCHYCTNGCPMHIEIPGIFSAVNRRMIFEDEAGAEKAYANAIKDHGKASECIRCGQCEDACPQHINIRQRLESAAEEFE